MLLRPACALACSVAAGSATAQGFYFTGRQPISELNASGYDTRAPAVQGDELYIVFASDRPGGLGDYDLWQSTRATVTSSWSSPTNLTLLNSASRDTDPHMSCDGLTLYFASSRPGGTGSVDLYVAVRPSRAAPWGLPVNLGPIVNGIGNANTAPALTGDGLALFFTSDRSGSLDIFRATRMSTFLPFGVPVAFAPTNSSFDEHSAIVEGNGELIWFASDRPGGSGGGTDYWLTCGDPQTGSYGPPEQVADLSTVNDDAFCNRGCTTGIMYTSQRDTEWVLDRVCPRQRTTTTESTTLSSVECIQVSTSPPHYVIRYTYTTTVTTTTQDVVVGSYRWIQIPNATGSGVIGATDPLLPPIDVGALLPGSEGYLLLSNFLVLSIVPVPPFAQPGVLTYTLHVPGNPSLAGTDVHLQWFDFDLVLNTIALGLPTTIALR